MQDSLDYRSLVLGDSALHSTSPMWEPELSAELNDIEFDEELARFYASGRDNAQPSAQQANVDLALQEIPSPGQQCIEDSTVGQQVNPQTIPMSLQSRERESDNLLTTENPNNSPPPSVLNKCAINPDESGYDTIDSGDREREDAVKRELEEIKSNTDSLNKRLKYLQVDFRSRIKGTSSTVARGSIRANDEPEDDPVNDDHAQSRGQGNQASRLSLSSFPSNGESQVQAIFTPPEQPSDTQSLFSQTTFISTRTSYPPGGKACSTCVKYLGGGSYFSTFRNHYWTTHYPQVVWYCLFCKMQPLYVDGHWSWQCRNSKCGKICPDKTSVIAHISDSTLQCCQRNALFVRSQPWKDHRIKIHSQMLPAEFLIDVSTGQKQCILCQDFFRNEVDGVNHQCPETANWKYRISTPFPTICEDHPWMSFDTYEKVNDHFEKEHFGQFKSLTKGCRRKNNDESNQDDIDSEHDNLSRNGKELQKRRCIRRPHGDFASVPTGSVPSEARHSTTQMSNQYCDDIGDRTTDLQGLSQGNNPDYPQEFLLDEGRPPSKRPEGPFYGGLAPVTEDGLPLFSVR